MLQASQNQVGTVLIMNQPNGDNGDEDECAEEEGDFDNKPLAEWRKKMSVIGIEIHWSYALIACSGVSWEYWFAVTLLNIATAMTIPESQTGKRIV
jgi:hypothetical protein